MPILDFTQEMLILYLIAIIGFIAKAIGILDVHSNKVLTQIVMYITLPALILSSMDFPMNNSLRVDILWLLFLSAFALFGACILAYQFAKYSGLDNERKGVYQSLMVFGNQGFIGYAIIFMLLGESGVFYVAIFNIFYLLLIWTYGIFLVAPNNRISIKQAILTPGLLATFIGLIIIALPISLPFIVGETLESIGMTTIPLSMLLIGSIIGQLPWKKLLSLLLNKYIWIASFTKLILVPLLLIPFIFFPSLHFEVFVVAVLVSGMPSAPTTAIFAEKYGADSAFAAFGVSITTILSMITLPMLYVVIFYLNP
ncbi:MULTISPECIES: AEC family transporter [Bacillaceae]|uniref:AEC family transporter n=1 Tax=Evansella alkalicola TaxID=745819 RepID=A0ABS6JTZ4_9BACI|nr:MULTISPECIES: AEC family transporter [Bacillaceae]MBU9722045.1 AEC family transporter [Bacillus alkalicola]